MIRSWNNFLVLATVCFATSSSLLASEPISFRQHIRPILSANCFKCHGPDPQTREADLRLDRFEEATANHEGHAAIVPGHVDSSELYKRIMSTDPAERMPPPESNKQLTDEQRELLKGWISEGARYERHWSFAPPKSSPPPKLRQANWPKNVVDQFVLAELERNEMQPSPPADRYQLVRRVYLDLIGLPPSPDEADRFVHDNRPDAYERLVDELLASPHYGERWARRWLDLARYSDTNGYEKDRPRTMWPYRDWVINALNDDMPFDQFTIEQLAGDMLPNATQSQRIATGFHRNTMVNEEGGVDPQEFRFNSIVDRVGTTGAVWLGLTIGCAQCHTHKYDPLTHQEYYGLFAFFNNADEIDEHLITPEIRTERNTIEKQIAELIASLPNQFPVNAKGADGAAGKPSDAERQAALEASYAAWQEKAKSEIKKWQQARPSSARTNLATIKVLPDASLLASGDVTKNDLYDLEFDLGERTITAIRIEALADESLPGGGPGRQSIEVPNASSEGDFFLSELSGTVAEVSDKSEKTVATLVFDSALATFTTPGLSPESAFDRRSDTGWRVMGRVGEPHAAVFHLKEPVHIAANQRLKMRLQHESFYPAGLGRFRISFSSATKMPPIALFPDQVADAIKSAPSERTAAAEKLLREYFLLHTPELKDQQAKIAELRKRLPLALNCLVLRERSVEPRVTHRHHRGEYLKSEETVEPGVPEFLPPQPPGGATNRLEFARWLVNGENPLVARVFVNRQWQAFFGRGIVHTLEDFGVQGDFPTHPELLDYLALEFVRQGWSMKRLHKLIVMSATYQQSDAITPDLLARDPENKLLARAPRFRVEAELVRDVILSASGLLSLKTGGPSVFPDQPAGITEAAYGPLAWTVSNGEDRFRRGLYTFNKRTAPFAVFGLFDGPSGEVCVPRRTYSNTPLQALAILNDTVMMSAARELATSVLKTDSHDERSVAERMFRRCATRPASEHELDWVCDFQKSQLASLAIASSDVEQLIPKDGKAELPPGVDKTALASWVVTARALLNLDETLTRP